MDPSTGRERSLEGVEALDHTADVGIQVVADTLPELYRRAALGALSMVLGAPPAPGEKVPPGEETRTLEVAAGDHPDLMRRWLREVLFLQEVEGFAAGGVDTLELTPGPSGLRLLATLRGGPAPHHPVREIKGVTWHGLQVEERRPGEWFAQVIFDV
jgi:SHS2 domain-containing protein